MSEFERNSMCRFRRRYRMGRNWRNQKGVKKQPVRNLARKHIRGQTHQTGTSVKSHDLRFAAKKGGRRISKSGKRYYEYRANRSDLNPAERL